MQPVTVYCRAPDGLDAPEVSVEIYLAPGLPGLAIVGMVETAVKESRDRVRAAIRNAGFQMPKQRIVVSLAPADLPKSGSRYDLAIAVGILCASGQVSPAQLEHCEFLGELSLAGELRGVTAALPIAMAARDSGRRIVVPAGNASDAGLLEDERVLFADDLLAVAEFLNGERTLNIARPAEDRAAANALPDLAEVEGQPAARRALEIAAAGGHHLLMTGPPGTGKSMLAQRLPGILPPLATNDALVTSAIYSLRGASRPDWRVRPFRSPHHSATAAALVGGSTNPKPGEISLAHNGVLFLDELPEFNRGVLETLREPLEAGRINIARARRSVEFPARFQLVAAMNPCPCGYLGDKEVECRCTPDQIARYTTRVSGPLLDRIDICIRMNREAIRLRRDAPAESSATVRERVVAARALAEARNGSCNGSLEGEELRRWCWPDDEGVALLEQAARKLRLSRRACNRVLRVARSIADMGGDAKVRKAYVAEALSLRNIST